MNRLDEIEKKLVHAENYFQFNGKCLMTENMPIPSFIIKDLTEITRDLAAVVRELKEKE